MGSSNSDWKFIGVTAILVALIAVPTLVSWVSLGEGISAESLVLRPMEQKARAPSSLPHQESLKKQVVIHDTKSELNNLLSNSLVSYDLSCEKAKVTDFVVEGSYLQLKGRDCSKGNQSPKLNIINKSNGFTASVFLLNTKEYQTDLIQLNEGMNKIFIEYLSPSGQREEHVLNVKAGAI